MTFRIMIDLEDDTIYAEDDEQVEENKDKDKK
jgi:hypothetical protein